MKKYLIFISLSLFPALVFAQCDYSYGKWDTSLSSMPVVRSIFSAVTYHDSIYIVGGGQPNGSASEYVSQVDIYIPGNDTWVSGITELPFPRGCTNACLVDDKIFVLGGMHFADGAPIAYDSLHIYDIQTNSWKAGQSLPTTLVSFGADTINGKIYVAGGGPGEWDIVNNLYVYDPQLDEWTEKASMNITRRGTCAKSWGGKLYVFGGYTGSGWSVNRTIEVYDPEKDEWTLLSGANIPRALMDMSLTGDQLLVIGGIHGYSGAEYFYTENISRYDLTTDSWLDFFSEGDHIPEGRQFPRTVFVNDRVYVFGGFIDGRAHDNVWAYSLKQIRQNIEIRDTMLVSESIDIDLAGYFSSSGDEEMNYSICEGYDDEIINASIENSVLKIERLTQESKSTEITVNVFDTEDTISSNTFTLAIPVGIQVHSENKLSVYPNPASDQIAINYNAAVTGLATLEIFNSTGQLIEQHIMENIEAGDQRFEWSVEDYSNGLYFAVLKTVNFSSGCKLLIQK